MRGKGFMLRRKTERRQALWRGKDPMPGQAEMLKALIIFVTGGRLTMRAAGPLYFARPEGSTRKVR